jgi:hypothetical protein
VCVTWLHAQIAGPSGSADFVLYFLDSGDYSKFEDRGIDGYDWIWPNQVRHDAKDTVQCAAAPLPR